MSTAPGVSADVPQPSAPGVLPLWVRALDHLCTLLAVLSLSAALFGGFRFAVFGVRVSMTQWWRPALLGLLILAARHWWWRSDPAWQRLGRWLRGWWTSADTRALLPIHLATRLGVLGVGFLAVVLIGFPETKPPLQIYGQALLDLPLRWDTGWYLSIINDGYRWSGNTDVQQNIAFFPAYPIIVGLVSVLLGRNPLWAGVLVSLVAFFWALVYLRRLAQEHLGDADQATAAVLFLATYPFAVFFSAAYTESLFLLAMVAAIFHFRHGRLWQASAWGLLAGLTRPNGAFLSVALGLMVLPQAWSDWKRGRFAWGVHLDRLAAAAAPGIGMLCYSTYVMFLTGHPFQWTAQQAAWGREYRSLDTLVTDRLAYVTERGLYEYASGQPLDLFSVLSVLFVLGACWPVYRRFGLPYVSLLLVNLLPPMAMGGMLSIGRITSVLFPAFLWMGAAVPAAHRGAWVAFFACLQGFAAVMFFTWRPLF